MQTQSTQSLWNKKSRSGVSYQYRPKEFQHHKTVKTQSHPTNRKARKNSSSNSQNNRRRIPNRPVRFIRDTFRPKFREHRTFDTTGLIDIFGDYENDGMQRQKSFGKRIYSIDYLMSLRRIPEYQNYDQLLPKQIQRRKSLKQYQEGSQSFGAYVRELHRHRSPKEEKIERKTPVLGRKKVTVKHVSDVRTDRPTKPPMRHKQAKMSFDEIEETKVLEKEEIREEVIEIEETKVVEVEEEMKSPEVKIETPVIEEVKEKKKKMKKVSKKKKKGKKLKFVETTKDGSSSFWMWILMICVFVGVISMIVIGMKSSESYDVTPRGDADWVSAVSSRKMTISDSFDSVGIPSVKLDNDGLTDYDFVMPLDRPSFPDWTSGFVPS